MFEDFSHHDPVFQDSGTSRPPRRRKGLRKIAAFLLANLTLLPILLVTHVSVAGEGIRNMLPVFSRKISTLPIPGASFARNHDGFDKIDLSVLAAVLIFAFAALVWRNLFLILHEFDGTKQQAIAGLVRLAIYVCIVAADAALFYAGLASQTSTGWSETPEYVAPLATGLFTALVAVTGAWHADFHTSRYS